VYNLTTTVFTEEMVFSVLFSRSRLLFDGATKGK
jgi:hypothetical protein